MKKSLALFLALMMAVASFSFTAGAYTASDWAKGELTKAQEMGLIPASLLNEDLTKPITRAEFAAVSVLLFEKMSLRKAEKAGTNPFTDTADEYVLKAYELGVTTGTSETSFDPGALLTREQAASMLTRVYKKLTINGWSIAKDGEFKLDYVKGQTFADDANISDWAKDSVYFMASKGIINGVGENKFAPKNVTEAEIASGYANASREQAIIIATRMAGLDYVLADGIATVDPSEEVRDEPEINKEKETYTIGFIGGSLTEGGGAWIKMTKDFLAEKMPDKEIVTINAGKGGTRSDYGTARFMQDIGQYAPDMVFIEFTVNDCGGDYSTYSAYTEAMIRQCINLPKRPAVILLHAPDVKRIDDFTKCYETMAYKDLLADHYDIPVVNAHRYIEKEYERIKEEKGYKTYEEYLLTMYQKVGATFDNHAGYDKYGEAILEVFNADYERCIAPIKDASVVNGAKRSTLDAKYNHIYTNDPRLQYSGPWKTYKNSSEVPTYETAASLSAKHFKYPYFPAGIKQVVNEQAAIGFLTTAKAIALNRIISPKGATAKVYVNNVEVGTFQSNSSADKINDMSNWVSLPGNGNKKVIIIVDAPTENACVFRFGSIIERF